MRFNILRVGALIGILGAVIGLGGCASPAGTKEMVSDSAQVVTKHPYSVAVRTAGGRETDKMGASQISDQDFAEALRQSITTTKLFSKVVEGQDSDYLLSVFVANLEQPMMGFSMTVKMEAAWSLTEVKSGKVIWKDTINSTYTASASAAFAGVERLRIATEGAARENIKMGIEELSKLSL